jgi:release factor glutamine methyltransferase
MFNLPLPTNVELLYDENEPGTNSPSVSSPKVRREPETALFAGDDGLDIYRRLIPAAARVLRPGGLLAMELGYDSLPGVLQLLEGWDDVETRLDLAGITRIALARRP